MEVSSIETVEQPVRLGLKVDPVPARPKILLVCPEFPVNLWNMSEAWEIDGRRASMNLSLPTLAALTPDGFDLVIRDENVGPIDLDESADIVGITGYANQHDRMIELGSEFRARGRLVVIGGPYASLSPGAMRPSADVLVLGEAERIWPEFLADYLGGQVRSEYREQGQVSLDTSPAPRVDLLPKDSYTGGMLQTSRGCPYACEFCDVIIYLGRRQRHKTADQIVRELDHLYDAGYRRAFLADDNFTANKKRSLEILHTIRDWNEGRSPRMSFNTQLSIELASPANAALMDACVEAGLDVVFVGIESVDDASLREVKKVQNTRRDLVESVHLLNSSGIQVSAGLIVGFDHDDLSVFDQQLRFAEDASIPMVSLTLLNAPEGTPLEARLAAEGRIRGRSSMSYFATNIVPKQMSEEELVAGAKWLMNRFYQPDAFIERVRGLTAMLPDQETEGGGAINGTTLQFLSRVRRSYSHLDAEYQVVPREVIRAFRDKGQSHALFLLTFYRHVIGMMDKLGMLDPELARIGQADEAFAWQHVAYRGHGAAS